MIENLFGIKERCVDSEKMLCLVGKLSLFCFIAALVVATIPELLFRFEFDVYIGYFKNVWLIHPFQYCFLHLLAILTLRGFSYQVAVRALFLGYVVGIGTVVSISAPLSWHTFGNYMIILAAFHYTEFLAIACINPSTLSINSFVLNHSVEYGVAACLSWVEFVIEAYYFPKMKEPLFISYCGLILCILGEMLRKAAMFTAKSNFNHVVQYEKRNNHELVTHGVYRLCRHPSYVGWFYWSIGTQMVLQNPFCSLAYAITSWRFFYDRILFEEITLLNFFGEEYSDYQKKVGTGLPFVSGYKLDI